MISLKEEIKRVPNKSLNKVQLRVYALEDIQNEKLGNV